MSTEPLPATMQASYLVRRMEMELRRMPLPELPPGGMILQVRSIGICGSDVLKIRNTPLVDAGVIGHEVAGMVAAVDARGRLPFQVGDPVVVGHVHVPCLHCTYCRHGSPAMCRAFKTTRIEPGGYAEYVALSADHAAHSVLRVPEGLPLDEATLVDPVACCVRALARVDLAPFDRVGVVGAGTMGVIFLQMLSHLQAQGFAFDISPARREGALRFGAARALDPQAPETLEQIRAATDGEGLDSVLLTFVDAGTIAFAQQAVRDGGVLCLFGGPSGAQRPELDFYGMFRRELTLLGSYSSTLADMGAALEWIRTGRVRAGEMISGRTGLAGILDAVKAMDDRTYRVIIHP